MASPTKWTWVWAISRRWWSTGKPGMLQSIESQRVGHNWVTELNWGVKLFAFISTFVERTVGGQGPGAGSLKWKDVNLRSGAHPPLLDSLGLWWFVYTVRGLPKFETRLITTNQGIAYWTFLKSQKNLLEASEYKEPVTIEMDCWLKKKAKPKSWELCCIWGHYWGL